MVMLWKGGWEKVAMVMLHMYDRKLHEQLILHTRQQKGTYSAFHKNFQEGASKSTRAIKMYAYL